MPYNNVARLIYNISINHLPLWLKRSKKNTTNAHDYALMKKCFLFTTIIVLFDLNTINICINMSRGHIVDPSGIYFSFHHVMLIHAQCSS